MNDVSNQLKTIHTKEVNVLATQIKTLQSQISDNEKLLNIRINNLSKEKDEKDKMLLQVNSIVDQYKNSTDSLQRRVSSMQASNTKSIIIYVIIAVLLGLIIGAYLF